MRKRVNIKKIASILILLALVVFFIYYLYSHFSDFRQLKLVNPRFIFVLIIITIIFTINNGLGTKFLLEPFKIKLKFKEWFGLAAITSFYNLITPFRGGAISRAVYLKSKHKFSYTHFLATLSGSYVIIMLTAGLAGLFATLAIYFTYGILSWVILSFLIIFTIPLLVIVIFSPRIPLADNKILNNIIHVINGWHSIRSNKKVILVVSLLTLLNLIIGTFGAIITYKILGINLQFFQALFMTSVGSLSVLVSITPGGLGVTEAIAVFLASIVGITPSQSLTASIIGRVVGTIVIFVLGPIYSYILLNHANIKDKHPKV